MLERGVLLRVVHDQLAVPEHDGRSIVDRVVERRACHDEAVEVRHRHARFGAGTEPHHEAALARPVQHDGVVDAGVRHGDHHRRAVLDDGDVAHHAGVQNGVDRRGVVRGAVLQPADASAVGGSLVRMHGCTLRLDWPYERIQLALSHGANPELCRSHAGPVARHPGARPARGRAAPDAALPRAARGHPPWPPAAGPAPSRNPRARPRPPHCAQHGRGRVRAADRRGLPGGARGLGDGGRDAAARDAAPCAAGAAAFARRREAATLRPRRGARGRAARQPRDALARVPGGAARGRSVPDRALGAAPRASRPARRRGARSATSTPPGCRRSARRSRSMWAPHGASSAGPSR